MSTRTSDKPTQDCHGFVGHLRPYVQLLAGLSTRGPRFYPRVDGMKFVMPKIALRLGFFSHFFIFPLRASFIQHLHSYSINHHRRYVILLIDSFSNETEIKF